MGVANSATLPPKLTGYPLVRIKGEGKITIPPAGKNEGGIKQSLTLKNKTNRQYGKY
jgi:hypothetical protein